VIGVEIRQYVGEGLRTLVPRVVGQTAEAQQRKGSGAVSRPRRTDWSWELYASELNVPAERIEVGRALVAATLDVLTARGLPWTHVFRKGYVAFQRRSGYNVAIVDVLLEQGSPAGGGDPQIGG
jgi:hypothetical protein